MHRHRLDVLDGYEVIGHPVVSATRLVYIPWVRQAVGPYGATQLPTGSPSGLCAALEHARLAVVPEVAGAA